MSMSIFLWSIRPFRQTLTWMVVWLARNSLYNKSYISVIKWMWLDHNKVNKIIFTGMWGNVDSISLFYFIWYNVDWRGKCSCWLVLIQHTHMDCQTDVDIDSPAYIQSQGQEFAVINVLGFYYFRRFPDHFKSFILPFFLNGAQG